MKTVSVLIPSNLNQRLDWLKHRLKFLYTLGHQGEVLVGVWGGHDKIGELGAFCESVSPKIFIVAQDGNEWPPKRLVELAEKASGRFAVIQGDDDFLLPSAFASPTELLDRDPSVTCAQGRCIDLVVGPDMYSPLVVNWYPLTRATNSDTVERFSKFLKNYSTTWHAMYRRPQFIARMRLIQEIMASTNNYVFCEGMGEFYSVITGKFFLFDEFYFVKGLHDQNVSRTLKADLSEKMPPYLILSRDFSPDYKILERRVFDLLESVGVQTSDPAIRKRILDGMVDYMGYVIFKRKGDFEPEEIAIKNLIKQEPLHPALERVLGLIYATRITS